MMATRTLSLERAVPFVEPFFAAMDVSFPRPPLKGTDRRRFDSNGTPSSSESAARMTSFVLAPVLWASALIASFSSSGMRRRTTGLDPGSGLRRFVGAYSTANASASIPTATSLRLTRRRALSRTSACFRDGGVLRRTPFRSEVLAVKVLAVYQQGCDAAACWEIVHALWRHGGYHDGRHATRFGVSRRS